MNIGLLFCFRNPPRWRRPWVDFYADQLQDMQLAEQLGFDTIWLSEHHFSEDGYLPSVLAIAAAAAASTKRVRIGTMLVILPLNNAVRVTEDATAVDIISNGRLDLGVGPGYNIAEFQGYGIKRSDRLALLLEGLDVIKGIWTNNPFSYQGTQYNLKDIRRCPTPVQTPHPPLWMGAVAPKAGCRTYRRHPSCGTSRNNC